MQGSSGRSCLCRAPISRGLMALAFVLLSAGWTAQAEERVRTDLSATVANGFARLVFSFGEAMSPKVTVTNGIIVVAVDKPMALTTQRVDKLSSELGDYSPTSRLDPDQRGLRLALGRKVTVNTMEAGEKLFIDMLPDTWRGLPPSLPQEVVAELSKRAQDAERRLRQLGNTPIAAGRVVKMRIATAPTFTRFAFQIPDGVDVSSTRDDDGLVVAFDGPVTIESGDVKGRLPPTVKSLEVEPGQSSSSVRLAMDSDVAVRAFREDGVYSVDVTPPKANAKPESLPGLIPKLPPAQPEKPAASVPLPPSRPRATASTPTAEVKPAEVKPVDVVPAEAKPAAAPQAVAQAVVAPPAQAATEPPAPPKAERAAPPPEPAPPTVKAETSPPAPTARPEAPVPAPAPPAPAPEPRKAEPKAVAPAVAMPGPMAPGTVVAEMVRQGGALKLNFPFKEPTSAALFRRGEVVWLVFDTDKPIDLSGLTKDSTGTFSDMQSTPSAGGVVVRLRVNQPWLVGAEAHGLAWTVVFGDVVLEPSQPVAPARTLADGRSVLTVPLAGAARVHRLSDPDAGDTILTVTAPGPARGLPRAQSFVEFGLLSTTHGLAVVPFADDIAVDAGGDKVVVSRPNGLVLSAPGVIANSNAARRPPGKVAALDQQAWGVDRAAPFFDRLREVINTASQATDRERGAARMAVAQFYLARGLSAEARGVIDAIVADGHLSDDPTPYLMRALAHFDLGHYAEALKDLSHPLLAASLDAAILRGMVHAAEGRWREARENFVASAGVVSSLPIDVQRKAAMAAMRAALEVRDAPDAARLLSEFETLGVPTEMEADVALIAGRLAEATDQIDEAFIAYDRSMRTQDGPARNEARLRAAMLRYTTKKADRAATVHELEGLAVSWRGDRTEIETMANLGKLYLEEGRFRDAFRLLDVALRAHADSDVTRDLHQRMSTTFSDLFLERTGDALPPLEALSIFYDYNKLVPIGRRGDEMIRRLADRLVSVDLLQQAAELLEHQVEQRLTGSARAQVAAKLATVHLQNRKPDRALKVLRATRLPELPQEIRDQRLLLEARAQSELGRHELALELVEPMEGREVDRLRADVHWAAKHWRQAAEALERGFGERWKSFAPLTEQERHDALRTAIGYALANDPISLDRFRSRFTPKMADGPDRAAFESVSGIASLEKAEFREVARAVSAIDSLEGFLRDYKARYGDEAKPTGAKDVPGEAPKPAPAEAPKAQQSAPEKPHADAAPARTRS